MVKRWEPNMLFCTHYTWIHSAICVNGMSNGAMGPWPHMFHPNVLYCVCELMPNAICMPKMCELCAEHVTWLWFVWYIWRGNRQTHTHTHETKRDRTKYLWIQNYILMAACHAAKCDVRAQIQSNYGIYWHQCVTPVRRLHIHDTIDTQFYHFQTHEFVFFSLFNLRDTPLRLKLEPRAANWLKYYLLFGVQLPTFIP